MAKKNLLGLESLETRETPSRGFSGFTLPTFQFVTGTVFADANSNGVRDAGENGVNGVRVYLDTNGNGARDAGEPSALTRSNLSISSANGQTVTRELSGFYAFNGAAGRQLQSGAVRVELPTGATLTTPVQSIPATTNVPAGSIGLAGVTGTPDVVTNSSPSIVFAPPSGGSSSASVYAVSSVGSNGQAFASISGSVSGNASVSGSASATGANGTITAVFVG